jgi:hypothetical protein
VRRHVPVAAIAAGVLAWSAAPAHAAWGPVLRPPHSENASRVSLAVNASGDVGVAWTEETDGSTVVRAFARRAGRSGRVHVLARAPRRPVGGLAAALDARGELTVVWVDQHQGTRRAGPITVRAAFRTPGGRWSGAQVVSRSSALGDSLPRLAASPGGAVALTFNAGIRAAPGVAVAWRTPGRRFGPVRRASGGARGYLQHPTLAFDARGRAYLAGTWLCNDESRSHGVLFTAAPRSRRFTGPRVIAPAPATHVGVALTGARSLSVAWLRAGCSTSEDLSGPVLARVLGAATAGAPVVVDPRPSRGLLLSPVPAGGADLTWTHYDMATPAGAIATARLAPDGTAGPAAPPQDGWAPVAATPAGSRLLALLHPDGFVPPDDGLAAQAAAQAPLQVAPLGPPSAFDAAVAPSGDALAVARRGGDRLRIAVWRRPAA